MLSAEFEGTVFATAIYPRIDDGRQSTAAHGEIVGDWVGSFWYQLTQPYRHPEECTSSLEPSIDDSSSPECIERDVNVLDPPFFFGNAHALSIRLLFQSRR